MSSESLHVRMGLALTDVQTGLDSILKFVLPHLEVANVHCSAFITKDHWNLLPPCMQQELLSLSNEQLQHLPLQAHDHISDGTILGPIEGDLSQNDNLQESSIRACSLNNEEINAEFKTCEEKDTYVDHSLSSDVAPNLQEFCTRARGLTIDGLRLATGVSDLFEYWCCDQQERFIGTFMNTKKCHEVEQMSSLCSALYHHAQCNLVVDFGSGKGYLGNQLVLQHGISVLGIDSKPGNTQSASRRNRILDKQWQGLERNSKYATENRKLTRKEKKQLKMQEYSDSAVSADAVVPATLNDPEITKSVIGELDIEQGYVGEVKAHYVPYTQFIDKTTDFMELAVICFPDILKKTCKGVCNVSLEESCDGLPQHFCDLSMHTKSVCCSSESGRHGVCDQETLEKESLVCQNVEKDCETLNCTRDDEHLQPQCPVSGSDKGLAGLQDKQCGCENEHGVVQTDSEPMSSHGRLCLTGLHTCGDLANTSIEAFVTSPAIQAMCNVGCCYHLMKQKFAKGELPSDSSIGFPMSQFLLDRGVNLGTAALNLASQSIHRVAETQQLQGERFFPRAVLEVLVTENCDAENVTWTGLRKLEQKCVDAHDYIAKGCERLGISEKVSNEMIRSYLTKYKDYRRKIGAFFQLKAILAPCIEAIVLLDRVCFLFEQETVKDVFLVKMFDPLKSPRCYGIVAVK